MGRFGFPILLGPGGFGRVQFDIERVLVDVLRTAVEQGHAVVSGIRADIAADLADVAGQGGQQKDIAVLVVVVEELVRSHADGKQRGSRLSRHVTSQRLDRRRRRPRQLFGRLGVEVRRILADQIEHRAAADRGAVGQRDVDRTFQQRVRDFGSLADLIASQGPGCTGLAVPPHKVAPLVAKRGGDQHLPLLGGRRLLFVRTQDPGFVGQFGRLRAEYFGRPQMLQGVQADQHR
jgi:hypothetical protein